ncbi:MAG: hypothetical protein U0R68_09570 [Candidatus Nanopelagicales bacterium]
MDRRTSHRSTSRRRAGLSAAAVVVAAALTAACGPSSQGPASVSSGASGGWSHGADVTKTAISDDYRVEALRLQVEGWQHACLATAVPEVFLASAQRALSLGHLGAARGLVGAADRVLHRQVAKGLVTASQYAEFTKESTAIVADIPTSGHVTRGAGFPVVPPVARCTGQSPDSRPAARTGGGTSTTSTTSTSSTGRAGTSSASSSTSILGTSAAALGQSFVATDPSSATYLGTPSQEEAIRSAVAIGIGALPEVVSSLAPEVEIPGLVTDVVGELANLFWPSSTETTPAVHYATWDDMTTYVQNEINSAVTQINQTIDANRITELHEDLTALNTAIDTYTVDKTDLTPSPTSFGGYSDVDRGRMFTLYSTLNNAFTSVIPHFTDDPNNSYKNLPETINLYTLYLTQLRGWVLSPDSFTSDATESAKFKAARQAELTAAIAKAQSVVNTQLPQLESTQPGSNWFPLDAGWNRHWKFMDAMYGAGYDQVYLWQFMDPAAYAPDAKTGAINAPPDRTVVATPCYGAFAEVGTTSIFTGLPVNGDPTQFLNPQITDASHAAGPNPLSELKLWGIPYSSSPSEIVGAQLTYQGQAPLAEVGNANPGAVGTSSAPDGGDLVLGSSGAGWITRVQGTYTSEYIGVPEGQFNLNPMVLFGGAVHAQFTTTKTDASGTAVSTTGPMIPASTPGTFTFDEHFQGRVLSWVGLPETTLGQPYSQGWGDSCMAFGFRLADSY